MLCICIITEIFDVEWNFCIDDFNLQPLGNILKKFFCYAFTLFTIHNGILASDNRQMTPKDLYQKFSERELRSRYNIHAPRVSKELFNQAEQGDIRAMFRLARKFDTPTKVPGIVPMYIFARITQSDSISGSDRKAAFASLNSTYLRNRALHAKVQSYGLKSKVWDALCAIGSIDSINGIVAKENLEIMPDQFYKDFCEKELKSRYNKHASRVSEDLFKQAEQGDIRAMFRLARKCNTPTKIPAFVSMYIFARIALSKNVSSLDREAAFASLNSTYLRNRAFYAKVKGTIYEYDAFAPEVGAALATLYQYSSIIRVSDIEKEIEEALRQLEEE